MRRRAKNFFARAMAPDALLRHMMSIPANDTTVRVPHGRARTWNQRYIPSDADAYSESYGSPVSIECLHCGQHARKVIAMNNVEVVQPFNLSSVRPK